MIKLIFGNIGSGKTASMVRYMKNNPHKNFITNIETFGKGFNHVITMKSEMIILKEYVKTKKDGEAVYKLRLNIDFWKELIKKHKSMNVIIDEAHIFFNPRRSGSKINIIMTDFLALLRRVLGSSDGQGELILISQLSRRLDVIAREMATEVIYNVNHYIKYCKKCNFQIRENNETPDKMQYCYKCNGYNLGRKNNIIEVWEFKNVDDFNLWKDTGYKNYYKHYIINDISNIFGNYETLQLNGLLSQY